MQSFDAGYDPIHVNWANEDGSHDGGQSAGFGFTIAWQRGSLTEAGRNGAFLIEVLEACLNQLEYFQSRDRLACDENDRAIQALKQCIHELQSRRNRRAHDGTFGTAKGS